MAKNNIITSVLMIPGVSEGSDRKGNRIFLDNKKRGIIIYGELNDDAWVVTDEYATFSLYYEIDEECQSFLDILGISLEDFVKNLKTYVIFKFGDLAFGTLRDFLYQLKHFIKTYDFKMRFFRDDYEYYKANLIGEFFSLLKTGDESLLERVLGVLEDLEEDMRKRSGSSQRMLASFESYFKFHDILKRFWNETTDMHERLFFFPVYLWWNLSGVIPMRPREFVLTPRDCLKKSGDVWKLTIMKDKLKGAHKTVAYKIEDDYQRVTYRIPDEMANLINWYIEETKEYPVNELNTLFIADTHYEHWGCCTSYTSRYFTYVNMCTCLRYFFEQIVNERYNYQIVYDKKDRYLAQDEIHYIYLGDTRHLAMINMVMEGAPPMIAEILAGQNGTDIGAHYYSNVTEFVECKARRQYMKMINGTQNYSISKRNTQPLTGGEYFVLGSGKLCCNEQVKNHDFSYCKTVVNENGLIGGCENCIYYRETGKSFKDPKEKIGNSLYEQLTTLGSIVKAYRLHDKYKEDLEQAILKLQNTAYSYQQYKMEQMHMQEIQNKQKGKRGE